MLLLLSGSTVLIQPSSTGTGRNWPTALPAARQAHTISCVMQVALVLQHACMFADPYITVRRRLAY